MGQGALFLAGLTTGKAWGCIQGSRQVATVGLLTDIHSANKLPQGSRFYRRSLTKVDYAFSQLLPLKPQRIVHLGDLVDSHPTDLAEEMAARTVAQRFKETGVPYHFVMGNHCLSAMNKVRYAEVTDTAGSYESFDIAGVRFILLDACFRSDGVAYANGKFDWRDSFVPEPQISWLSDRLSSAKGPCVVLTHQLLDGLPGMSVKNHERVRSVLSRAGNVCAVIQGHFHFNRLVEIDGIPYTVLRSVVDGPMTANCGYSHMSVFADGSVRLDGFAEQADYTWSTLRARSASRRRG